jgi:hypothetical protein
MAGADEARAAATESREGAGVVDGRAKLPYAPPKLVHLGSVRDLTLGHSKGSVEFDGTHRTQG